MTPTTHREENIEVRKAKSNITRGNDIECGRVIKDMIVKGEFATENKGISKIAPSIENRLPRDKIDALGLDGSPGRFPNLSSSGLKLFCADFTGPVSFDGLFDLAVLSCGCMFRSMIMKIALDKLTNTGET